MPKRAPSTKSTSSAKRPAPRRMGFQPVISSSAPPGPPIPETDLATLAGQIPAEILQQLATAVKSGRWLFAVWQVSDGTIHLERTAANFPLADLDKAVEMLTENLGPLKSK